MKWFNLSSFPMEQSNEKSTTALQPRHVSTPFPMIVSVGVLVVAFVICQNAYMSAYHRTKKNVQDDVYQKWYEWGYQHYAVSNEVTINLSNIKQESKLEVLNVRDVMYEVKEKSANNSSWGFLDPIISSITDIFTKDSTMWLEIPCEAVYTVDMGSSEFIIDELRRYVLIRVPNVEISNCEIIYSDVQLLYYDKGGSLMNKAASDVVNETNEIMINAKTKLLSNMQNNQQFYKAAQESTKRVLTDWVKKLNLELPDLTVEVEFMES